MKNIAIKPFSFILILSLVFCLTTSFTWQQTWGTFLFRSASFKMKFPKLPDATDKDNLLLANVQADGLTFQVAAHYKKNFDLKKASSLLKESIDGFINSGSDKIISQKDNFTVENSPAREVRIQTSDGMYIIFRTVITKDCLFQFVLTSSSGFPAESVSDGFLNSFELL